MLGVSPGLRIVLGKTGVGRQARICGKLRSGRGENSLWLEKLNIVLRAKGDLIIVIRSFPSLLLVLIDSL